MKFLDWWGERLKKYCFDDKYEALEDLTKDGLLGLFTDKKWIDLVPSYFDNFLILKEQGYNLCTWNLTNRTVTKTNSEYLVDNKPIYFFHFSGFDSGGHINELQRVCEVNPSNEIIKELSIYYENENKKNDENNYKDYEYAFSCYTNGVRIQDFERKLLHIRQDVHKFFPNPYEVNDEFCFFNWVRAEYSKYFKEKVHIQKESTIKKILKKIIYMFFPPMTKRNKYLKKLYYRIVGRKC